MNSISQGFLALSLGAAYIAVTYFALGFTYRLWAFDSKYLYLREGALWGTVAVALFALGALS